MVGVHGNQYCFLFLMALWTSCEKWAAEPMASSYSDCISNQLNSAGVYFKHGGLAGCGGWYQALFLPQANLHSIKQCPYRVWKSACTRDCSQDVAHMQLLFPCQVASLLEAGPRPVSLIKVGVFHVSRSTQVMWLFLLVGYQIAYRKFILWFKKKKKNQTS